MVSCINYSLAALFPVLIISIFLPQSSSRRTLSSSPKGGTSPTSFVASLFLAPLYSSDSLTDNLPLPILWSISLISGPNPGTRTLILAIPQHVSLPESPSCLLDFPTGRSLLWPQEEARRREQRSGLVSCYGLGCSSVLLELGKGGAGGWECWSEPSRFGDSFRRGRIS